jgi:hypothetical protein
MRKINKNAQQTKNANKNICSKNKNYINTYSIPSNEKEVEKMKTIPEKIKQAEAYFRQLSLDVFNGEPDTIIENYQEKEDLIDDITDVIRKLNHLGYMPRTTQKGSKIQAVHIGSDGYIKILGINSNKTNKSKTTFAYHRVKHILADNGLSDGAKIKQLDDKKKVKDIEVDHWDGNKLNNKLSNLHGIPRRVNQNKNYKRMQKMNLPANQEKYARENNCEDLLRFLQH